MEVEQDSVTSRTVRELLHRPKLSTLKELTKIGSWKILDIIMQSKVSRGLCVAVPPATVEVKPVVFLFQSKTVA